MKKINFNKLMKQSKDSLSNFKSLILPNNKIQIDPRISFLESFKTLRTNVQLSDVDKQLKTIAITSSEPLEGKATVIKQLANAMSLSGSKVLVLDCDLRKPKLHKAFGLDNNIGFTNVLLDNLELNEVYNTVNGMDNLKIITSGPVHQDPFILLNSNEARSLINSLKDKFDIILINTPPVGVVTDAEVLSTYVDGIILVVSYGETKVDTAIKCKNLLKKVNAPILGVVFNKVPSEDIKYDSYYFGQE